MLIHLVMLGFWKWNWRNIGVATAVAGAILMLIPGCQAIGAGLLTISLAGLVVNDIAMLATGQVYVVAGENNVQIVGSSKLTVPIIMFGYSIYTRIAYHKQFTGSAAGIYAEWLSHNIAYHLLGLAKLCGIKQIGNDSIEKLMESAEKVDIGSNIWDEKRWYKWIYLLLELPFPISFLYDLLDHFMK